VRICVEDENGRGVWVDIGPLAPSSSTTDTAEEGG
jgi:hypothetical protein